VAPVEPPTGVVYFSIFAMAYFHMFVHTSCTRFLANQLRVLLTAAAYVLMQEIRAAAANTSLARAQVGTLRERLFKLGVEVVVSVRRIVLHLPATFPFLDEWRDIAVALGAGPG
jgi:hypothetical protein